MPPRSAIVPAFAAWLRRREAMLAAYFPERERRFAGRAAPAPASPTFGDHEASARAAGFGEVGTLWRDLDFRLLLAVCPPDAGDAGGPADKGD